MYNKNILKLDFLKLNQNIFKKSKYKISAFYQKGPAPQHWIPVLPGAGTGRYLLKFKMIRMFRPVRHGDHPGAGGGRGGQDGQQRQRTRVCRQVSAKWISIVVICHN